MDSWNTAGPGTYEHDAAPHPYPPAPADPALDPPTQNFARVPAPQADAFDLNPQRAPVAGYRVPEVPESAWSVDTRRSTLISRGALLCVLLVQAILTLRLGGSVFQDEALYIASGHYELTNLLHGTPLPVDFADYFSGHPKLYPVLAALVDDRFGLSGVRFLSLLFLLATTTLLYASTRRLFNARSALGAAALFAVVQPTLTLGRLATYDGAALFLLALGLWLVVRTGRMRVPAVLLAAPPIALACGVKYAAALYVPTLVLLAVLTAYRQRGARTLLRGVVLGLGILVLLGLGYALSGPLGGITSTTTDRAHGGDPASRLLDHSAQWGGLLVLTAAGGSIAYVLRARMVEMPWVRGSTPGRWRRALLGLLLTGTAFLAPAYQIHLQTEVSLFKHVGFGLLFAAPMAGLGMSRLIGPHFRNPQLGIMLFVLTLVLGMVQAQNAFSWPDARGPARYLRTVVDREGLYLAEESEVPAYLLRDRTGWNQWVNTTFFAYTAKDGKRYEGSDPVGFAAAVRDARFDAIMLRGGVTPEVDAAVEKALRGNPHYRLTGRFPTTTSSGDSVYRIWVKQ
ncbi:glycosyltransferase family 39 protein [Streptomyces evansiae]|uniref:glycosyltransferase family 39 protein n=1 Tax=Streptomyces evansiae TaxID=3075535 RepID=UPI0028853955|nr:glycosyltransferase family 39 protein [Streptomyces sp. DSM 41859]MDT0423039.1 glycosyltransferase family 39 protein [Streptomyces sp. DSM 41859]